MTQRRRPGDPSRSRLGRRSFGAAAANAQHVGFDGVEISCSARYLFDQFLLGRNQSPRRSVRRFDAEPDQVGCRYRRRDTSTNRAGTFRSRCAFPSGRSNSAQFLDASGVKGLRRAVRQCRGRCLSLLPTTFLGRRIRNRLQPGCLDQKSFRQAEHIRRFCRHDRRARRYLDGKVERCCRTWTIFSKSWIAATSTSLRWAARCLRIRNGQKKCAGATGAVFAVESRCAQDFFMSASPA